MTIDSEDEFYGKQSSESDASTDGNRCSTTDDVTPSDPFGNVATHEYRSRERSIKTLSYLDGYDETKEEKLQDGFSHGYRQSFNDAFRIGRQLGSLCAKAALYESSTFGTPDLGAMGNSGHDYTTNIIEGPASLVRKFLRDEILVGRIENNKTLEDALSKLDDQLSQVSI